MPSRPRRRDHLLLTCEHAGNAVPREYRRLFAGEERLLASHRGWDIGALALARTIARRVNRPVLAVRWTRLLVEANRSLHNPRLWSPFTRPLPRHERAEILARWWRPHRTAVESAVAAAVREARVVHVAVHSFTPELDGEVRNADIGLLYDPKRRAEAALCARWAATLERLDPSLRVRLNYPYRGDSDALGTELRKRFPASRYLAIEIEINQGLVGSARWRRFRETVAASFEELFGAA